MGIIVKVSEFYLEWSGVVDAPTTFGMSKEAIINYCSGEGDIEKRMARVDATGTSSKNGTTAEELIAGNRAGPNEAELTFEEIYQAYCLRLPIRGGWVVPVC